MIMADDIGWFNVSVPSNLGVMGHRKPTIDRIAKEVRAVY